MKPYSPGFFFSVTCVIGLVLISMGIKIRMFNITNQNEYFELMERVDMEIATSLATDKLKTGRIISELESRREIHKNLLTALNGLTKGVIASGSVILVCQVCLFHFLFSRAKAQQGRADQPATAVESKSE